MYEAHMNILGMDKLHLCHMGFTEGSMSLNIYKALQFLEMTFVLSAILGKKTRRPGGS